MAVHSVSLQARIELERRRRARLLEAAAPVSIDYESFLKFAESCTIRSGTKYIPFSPLFEYQKAIAKLIAEYRGVVIVKDRQLGITELLICWMLYRATQNEAYASATFSLTERDVNKVSMRVKRMPTALKEFEWSIDSVGLRQPVGGGEMHFRPSTNNATRGLESIWDLFFDEAGFIPIISEMYAASSPSQEMVQGDARTFIVSTIPLEGKDSWFWARVAEDSGDVDAEEMLSIARSGSHYNGTKVKLDKIPGLACWEDESGEWVKIAISHKAHPIYGAIPDYVNHQRLKKKITIAQAEREHNLGIDASVDGLIDMAWFNDCRYDRMPERLPSDRITVSIDTATSEKEINDPSACLVFLTRDGRHYLLEEWHEWHEFPELQRRVIETCDRWQPHETLIENKSSGIQLIQTLRDTHPRYNLIAINPDKDKIMRMNLELGAIESGCVWLPRFASWLPEFEAALKFFPDYRIKDPVDALSQFLMRHRTRPVVQQITPPAATESARSLKSIF
jgi:predicted phage terminase large subunit-like protein